MAGSAYKKVKTQNIDEEAATQHLLDVAATPHFLPLQTPVSQSSPPLSLSPMLTSEEGGGGTTSHKP